MILIEFHPCFRLIQDIMERFSRSWYVDFLAKEAGSIEEKWLIFDSPLGIKWKADWD